MSANGRPSKPLIATPWTCIFCNRTFYDNHPQLIGPGINARPSPVSQQFLGELMLHMTTQHRPQALQAEMEGRTFTTLLMINAFKTAQETGAETLRRHIHNRTRAIRITDAVIEARVTEMLELLPVENEDFTVSRQRIRSNVTALLKRMRNTLEEIDIDEEPQKIT